MAPKAYPEIPASIWWALRDEFRRSLPKAVDRAYLSSKMKLDEKSARNTIPRLRAVGLVDESGRPTELALSWRDQETYREACDGIIHQVFPDVAAAFPPPDPDRDQLKRWFAAKTGIGDSGAAKLAGFYRLLAAGDPTANSKAEPTDAAGKKARTIPRATRKTSADGDGMARASGGLEQVVAGPQDRWRPPTLHIDLQVHLAADAPDSQIESLFRNMAKYIYGKTLDE